MQCDILTHSSFKRRSLWQLWILSRNRFESGCQGSSVGRTPNSWSKGRGFDCRRERLKMFLLQSWLSVLTLIRCPFHPRVAAVARKKPNKQKNPVILPKVQVAGYTLTLIHPWLNEVGVGWLCCPGIEWESGGKRAHTQLVRERSSTVVSARWASVDWSWPKE